MPANLIFVCRTSRFFPHDLEMRVAPEEIENRQYTLISVLSVEVWQVRFFGCKKIA